jgi:mRNA interferase MazF
VTLYRGQVVQVQFKGLDEPKLFLVVSNNERNRKLRTALAARLTTSAKPPRPSVVEIPPSEGAVHGRVLCDDIIDIYEDEVLSVRAALTPRTMEDVNVGLAYALGLPYH